VAIDKRTKRPLAIGAEAKEMVGRTPAHIVAIRPLRDGVISEFEITEAMLDYFIKKAHQSKLIPIPRPRVVVGIPSGVTEVEKRAVYDATISAGARELTSSKSRWRRRWEQGCPSRRRAAAWWLMSAAARARWRYSLWVVLW